MELFVNRRGLRSLSILVALAALALCALIAPRAEAAKVGNPGAFGATVTSGTIQIKTQTFNFTDADPITFAGTIDAAGNVNIPVSGQHFPSFAVQGYPVSIIPTHPITGTVNPMTGAGSLRLRVYIKIDGVPTGGGCAIGSSGSPIDLNALITGTTAPPGPNTPISGTPYNTSNGTATVVNNSYSVPASNSCGQGASTVDGALGLPSAAGNNSAVFNLVTNPFLQKGVNASYTITPNSGFTPLNSNFSAAASSVPAGVKTCTPALPSTPNCGYRWDWDNNGTVDQVTNTNSTSHTYSTPGNYTTRLTIYDSDGDTDTTTRTVTVTGRPDLAIDKSHTGDFQTGNTGTYTIDVDNNGNGATTGTTTVTDTLPSGLSYQSASGAGWTCGAAPPLVTCTRTAAIPAGGSAPSITLTVNVGDSARPAVTNTAGVATPDETATSDNTDSDPTDVKAIDVAVDKSHTGSFRVNRNEDYELRVTNDGSLATTGTTTVSDTLPIGMNYFSSSAPAGWNCNGSGNSFSCTNPNPLPVGYDETITLTVAVDGQAVGTQTNTATISTPGDTDPTDDSSSDLTVVVAAPDLAIDKSHDGDFRVGTPGVYELDVTNDGALPTAGTTTVTDTVPAELPVQSASGGGWNCNVSGQDVTCTNPTVMQPDESLPTITITTGVTQAAIPLVSNSATVATSGTGQDADPNPVNDTDADPTAVTATDLAIDKSHSGTFPVGGNGSFTLAVRNDGTAPTAGTTTVTDTLPAELSYVSASGSGWSCNASGQDVTCTRAATIGANAAAPNITLTVAVANTNSPDVTNTATVAGADDINAANDSDSDTAALVAADLQIVKSHSGDFVVGTQRAYDLKVKNVGPLPTTGTNTVTDVLPTGLSFVSASGPNWSCNNGGQTVTCTRTNPIAGGGPASTIQVLVDVGAAAFPGVTNTATVDNANDRNPANDSSSDPTTVKTADLAIAKTHSGQLRAGVAARPT
ncbi:MAG: PKD domain-containing protein [Solirubrobacterales bacterium]